MIEAQQRHRAIEVIPEFRAVALRNHLGLHDETFAWKAGQKFSELVFRTSVAPRGLDMIDVAIECPLDRCLEIFLVVVRRILLVFPGMLEAHAPAREDGHLDLGSAKASAWDHNNFNFAADSISAVCGNRSTGWI